jgi:dGTPase
VVGPIREEERRSGEPDTIEDSDVRTRRRTAGERDRDRVMYSTAFQRLAGITQVVPVSAGGAAHSRLTHSLKVAQVARRLAQRVTKHNEDWTRELDPDSVEAAALAHDLGHPPFGHIGEEEINAYALLSGAADGFEGNAQSFRLVTRLAQRWPTVDGEEFGLNLTRRTLDGLLKYPWLRNADHTERSRKFGAYRADEHAFSWVREARTPERRSPAAAVMDWADDLTYAVHDMEDFFRAGLIPLDRLCTSEIERERSPAASVTPTAG